jgi:uncharacterized protein
MRITRADDYARMPWKNGGGETAEIAIHPPGAALAAFDWRVSMARVEIDGPFSRFPGVDRTLALLDGEGLCLYVDDTAVVELDPGSPPCTFPGDANTRATLVRGAVTDFNVMTRRDRFRHEVTRVTFVAGEARLATGADTMLLFCAQGRVSVRSERGSADLYDRDSMLVESAGAPLELRQEQPALVWLVRFTRKVELTAARV